MKGVLKSVAALACIAVVCAALIVVVSLFLPKQTRTFEYGEFLGDSTAQFEEVDLMTLDADLREEGATKLTAVYKAVSGAAAGGVVLRSEAVTKYGSMEMIVGVSKDSKIVKVTAQVLKNNSFYSYPFVQENYDKFVGANPLEMKPSDLVSSTKATATKEAMLRAAGLAYKAGVALTGGAVDAPSEEVVATRDYFSKKVVAAAKIQNLDAVLAAHVTAYSVSLEDGTKGYVFVDTKVYHKFTVTIPNSGGVQPDEMTSNDANGTFYLSVTGVGITVGDGATKFAKIKTDGNANDKVFYPAATDLLEGKTVGKITVADYNGIIGAPSDALDLGAPNFSGATASGIGLVKNVNAMTEYILPYLASVRTGGGV